jgi:ATP-dependent DNA helicase MPH1
MSDYDDYFDSIDEEALAQLRELETQHTATSPSRNAAVASSSKKAASSEDDSDLFEFSLNNDELAELEEAAVRQQNSPSKASTSNGLSTSIPTSRQMNLHGERVMDQPAPKQPQQRPAFGQKLRKTKVWDCTAFAKTGWKNTKPQKNGKGKAKAVEDPDEEEYVDVEGLVTPFMPRKLSSPSLSDN